MIEDERDFAAQTELGRSYLTLNNKQQCTLFNHCFGVVCFQDLFASAVCYVIGGLATRPKASVAQSHSLDLCLSPEVWDRGGGTERLTLIA